MVEIVMGGDADFRRGEMVWGGGGSRMGEGGGGEEWRRHRAYTAHASIPPVVNSDTRAQAPSLR